MTKLIQYRIAIDGKRYAETSESIGTSEFQAKLRGAHKKGITVCLCMPFAPVKLSVKCYGANTDNPTYRLACWPNTGIDHDINCDFFTDESTHGQAANVKPAFEENEDGSIRVFLESPLKHVTGGSAPAAQKVTERKAATTTRQHARDISLLLKLWRTANLNIYRGKKVSWFNACHSLLAAANKFIINKEGETLHQYLLVGGADNARNVQAHNSEVLLAAKNRCSDLFVIGRLRGYSEKDHQMLSLKDFQGLPRISVNKKDLDNEVGIRPFYKNILENKSGNVVVLARIQPGKNEWWNTRILSAFATSENMLPAESSYEIEFEEYLVRESRVFLKPLVMNEDDDGSKRPDFILLDTSPRVYVEVWGMQTPEYLASKQKRLEYYNESGKSLISWNANPKDPLPPLPRPRSIDNESMN